MNGRQKLEISVGRVCEALSNPLRMKLFVQILKDGCDCSFDDGVDAMEATCVKGLMVSLDMPQSTVSTYIKDLESAGLIECHKVGRQVFCRPAQNALLDFKVFIDGALKQIRYK